MDQEKVVNYDTGEITIHWKPGKCIHAGECVKNLPNAYRPGERPWIKVDQASAEEFRAQIAKCPSGALSFSENQ